jgi:hypothetical protein
MKLIHNAQFEISVDGVPRSYRDRKDLALQGAKFLKSRNPNSVIKLKDLQTGERHRIQVAGTVAPWQYVRRPTKCRQSKDGTESPHDLLLRRIH